MKQPMNERTNKQKKKERKNQTQPKPTNH